MSDRVAFTCNGHPVDVEAAPGETLLSVLRERLGILSVKDGCAPQGQCGCCTVLVDGAPRVACVTPAARVAGRAVTTVEGLPAETRDRFAAAFVAHGGSQCGFCTPGIIMRAAGSERDVDRALAAHLCRCTGWLTVKDAIAAVAAGDAANDAVDETRDLHAASERARLEGDAPQHVDRDVPLGGATFADDGAPRDALVAVPRPPGSEAPAVDAAGMQWVLGDSLSDARAAAGKVQGRRTTVEDCPPFDVPEVPARGVALATSWVEPAYLEPDASWCAPNDTPASPLANGGAFGGKVASVAPVAAAELADRLQRTVRVVFAREDVVRLGAKRPPIAATAHWRGDGVDIEGVVARGGEPGTWPSSYTFPIRTAWSEVEVPGPPVSRALRAAGLAEQAVLVEGALDAAGIDRVQWIADPIASAALLDTVATAPSGAVAGARVTFDDTTGALRGVQVRVAAGDPLDETVLRSYAFGAAHMALGWVLTESIAVDPATGEVQDLTIRSFGILRARDVPPIDVVVLDDERAPCGRSSDAVFAAVAAATWNALATVEGTRPATFPARDTRAARLLRR